VSRRAGFLLCFRRQDISRRRLRRGTLERLCARLTSLRLLRLDCEGPKQRDAEFYCPRAKRVFSLFSFWLPQLEILSQGCARSIRLRLPSKFRSAHLQLAQFLSQTTMGKSQSKLSPEQLADLQKNTYCTHFHQSHQPISSIWAEQLTRRNSNNGMLFI
jgi:hypothetical protein